MSFISYWEIFGIILVTLYFILSLLFPKTKDSHKEKKKHEDGENKRTSKSLLRKDLKKVTVKSLKTVEQRAASSKGNKSSREVIGSYNTDDECSTIQQEVTTELHKRKSTPLNLQDTVCSDGGINEVDVSCSSVKEASIEPLQASVIETQKLSELADESLSFSKEPQESLQKKPDRDTHAVNSERHDNEMQKLDKHPSKYLYKESKNRVEGLPISGDVSIDRISNSTTDKPGEESFSREIQPTEVKISLSEEIKASIESENCLTTEMATSRITQNNNLEKFANGLASSTIETAVDNSVCLSNFAENLSEKIFWASADDVISEVQANIEKERQELSVNNEEELKPIKLDSLSCSVASEVVNEAVGEAALREEYKSEEETEVSPQQLQPHLGYVVENVVNNAICEAALKIKKDEDEDIDNTDVLETPSHNEDSHSESIDIDVSENISETIVHGDVYSKDEQFISSSPIVDEYNHNSVSDDINSITTDEKLEDDVQIINKEIESHAVYIHTEQGSISIIGHDGTNYEETEASKDHPNEAVGVGFTNDQSSDHEKNKHEETESSKSQSAQAEGADFANEQTSEPSIIDHNKYEHEKIEALKCKSAEHEGADITNKQSNSFVSIDKEKFENEIETSNTQLAEVERVVDHDKNKHEETKDPKSHFAEVEETVATNDQSCEISAVNQDNDKHGETKDKVVDNNRQSDIELQSSNQSGVEQANQEKDELKSEENKDFWRRSLILDLEQDLDLEESFSSDATSPGSPKPFHLSQERSDDYSDSEEDEIIDHDADAELGAVGGSNTTGQSFNEEDFDFYDYGSDDDIIIDKDVDDDNVDISVDANDEGDDEDEEEELFEPVLTVDGLCISKQTRKGTKKRGNLKSVGSHYNRAIVLDNGCGYIKLGYAGDRVPRVTEQTVSGIPSRFSMQMTGMGTNLRDFKKFGSEAVSKAGVMHLSHPMKAEIIDNWTDVEDIWEFMIYNQLGAEVGDNPIIMTEISNNPKKNREKITEILFEHLNVPAMYLADQLPLSIYASGLTSGLCLSSGYSCSQAAVVYEGHTLSYSLQHLNIGGGHLTENLKLLLRDNRGHNFTTSSGWQIVNDIKETEAFVAKDFNSEVQSYKTNDALTKFYTLPDGQVIDIGYECMSCVEPLFQPSELLTADVTTASQSPVHEMVNKAIKRCDKDLQQMCHNHIILSGGTTLLKGFTTRLQHELHQINHSIRKIRTPDHRRYSPWIGGSILGSLSVFEDQYVTMDEYGDSGPRIVHKKCF